MTDKQDKGLLLTLLESNPYTLLEKYGEHTAPNNIEILLTGQERKAYEAGKKAQLDHNETQLAKVLKHRLDRPEPRLVNANRLSS